jgi:hypothetical protein
LGVHMVIQSVALHQHGHTHPQVDVDSGRLRHGRIRRQQPCDRQVTP